MVDPESEKACSGDDGNGCSSGEEDDAYCGADQCDDGVRFPTGFAGVFFGRPGRSLFVVDVRSLAALVKLYTDTVRAMMPAVITCLVPMVKSRAATASAMTPRMLCRITPGLVFAWSRLSESFTVGLRGWC